LKPGLNGVARIIAATRNSFRGTRDAWLHESAFRQDAVIFLILFLLSFGLARTVVEWLVLIFPLFLLLIVEILNSAIENTVDRISGDRHILSGRAKDMGSAAVMYCLILILIVWSAMIWSRYFA
jgi:diacylglycerol kinase (ATP)